MPAASLLTPRQAAEKLGISYPALKHWILAGRIRTVKTPGGHHRIPVDALDEFLPPATAHPGSARISGRNQLSGTVLEVTIVACSPNLSLASESSASPPSSRPMPCANSRSSPASPHWRSSRPPRS